jgi:hypothetical protein
LARAGVRSLQQAELRVSPERRRALLAEIDERYWQAVEELGRGFLAVAAGHGSVTVATRPAILRLMRFREAERVLAGDTARIRWTISDGLLVARRGRGRGFLELEATERSGDRVSVRVLVEDFHPRLPRALHRATQLRIHEKIGRRFLASLPGGVTAFDRMG